METKEEIRKHNISVRRMPMSLWREFRSYCLRHEINVEEAIVQAIDEYLVKRIEKEAANA